MTCDKCGKGSSEFQVHVQNCAKELFGTCACPINSTKISLSRLEFHGRYLDLCQQCYAEEKSLLQTSEASLHEYRNNVPDSLERRVENWKKQNLITAKWQEVFVVERPNWIIENFNSIEEMNEAMFQFITSMESLEFEIKAKRRAVYEASKELNSRLTKEERLALINDPSFKPATNSEFKKIAKQRELDEVMKTLELPGATKEQRKNADKLLKMGMKPEDIKKAIKFKEPAGA